MSCYGASTVVWISGCVAIRDECFVLTGCCSCTYRNSIIPISPSDFRYRKQKESAQGKGTELQLRSRLSPSPRKSQGHADFRNGFFLESSDSSPVQEELEKPSGKRKCKTKHLAGICDEGKVWLELVGRNERVFPVCEPCLQVLRSCIHFFFLFLFFSR